jgi:hypothetical protein
MVERRVARDSPDSDRVVQDEMCEEAAVAVAAGRVVREEESILLQTFPEPLRGERMVLGTVLSADNRDVESSADRVVRLGMPYLHGLPRTVLSY